MTASARSGEALLQTEKGEARVPLTRDFKETIRERVQRDPKFRKELLREGLEAILSGEIAGS